MAEVKKYRVVVPVVVVKTRTSDGVRWVDLHKGGLVPPDAEQQWIESHLRDGLIAEVKPPPAAKPAPAAPAPPPSPPAAEVKPSPPLKPAAKT